MLILAIEISLNLPDARSLKDKRSIRQSLTAKLKKNFALSVRESDLQDNIRELVLAAAFVCLSTSEGEQYVRQIQDFLYEFSLSKSCQIQSFDWDIVDVFSEYGSYGSINCDFHDNNP